MNDKQPAADTRALAQRLGHDFSCPRLLAEALTHRSVGGAHNERLEFLGDAVLNLVIAAELYRLRPRAPEGDLSRLRASLVRERTLAEIAAEIDLGAALRMGCGERRSGGFRRASILADALEALLGAVYLDAGFAAAESIVQSLFADRLRDLPEADELKDSKTRLQEWLQARGRPLPEYRLVEESGEAHERRFVILCTLDTGSGTEGEGSGRRRAEQMAARRMLEHLLSER